MVSSSNDPFPTIASPDARDAGGMITFSKADNNRVAGWQKMRGMMEASFKDVPESAGLWVFETIFLKDLAEAEAIVTKSVRIVLNNNQFSALAALAFNIPKAFANTTLVDVLNSLRFDDAPEQILRWHRMGKKPVKGLIRRRAAEAMLFVS